MANWKFKIDVSEIWQKYEDDNDFESFISELIPALKAKQDEVTEKVDEDEAMDYEDMLNDLEGTTDEDEFDFVWQQLYDWADFNKVWIATF
jgi:Zn-dependent M32 family carboxypeptidase